jgi:hypothetical protein
MRQRSITRYGIILISAFAALSVQGAPLKTGLNLVPPILAGNNAEIPATQLLHIAEHPARDMIAATRVTQAK